MGRALRALPYKLYAINASTTGCARPAGGALQVTPRLASLGSVGVGGLPHSIEVPSQTWNLHSLIQSIVEKNRGPNSLPFSP